MSNTSPYNLNVAWEQVDEIIKSELRGIYDDMDEALSKIEDGEKANIFEYDVVEDRKMIEAHLNAVALILEYYGEKL